MGTTQPVTVQPLHQVSDARPGELRSWSRAIRVLLVDDHAILRAGLRQVLQAEPDLDVVAEAPDGAVAARLALELKPNVVVMDLSMPILSGVEATKQIAAREPNTRVLALSAHADPAYAKAALSSGAAGYALKRSAVDELVRAIRTVAAGGTYVDPLVAEMLSPQRRPAPSGTFPTVSLSERELAVVRLVAQGYTAKEIAQQLGVSPRTLETYKARAMAKLELTTRADLIRHALRTGWLREA